MLSILQSFDGDMREPLIQLLERRCAMVLYGAFPPAAVPSRPRRKQ
jgi:hypothetical protein